MAARGGGAAAACSTRAAAQLGAAVGGAAVRSRSNCGRDGGARTELKTHAAPPTQPSLTPLTPRPPAPQARRLELKNLWYVSKQAWDGRAPHAASNAGLSSRLRARIHLRLALSCLGRPESASADAGLLLRRAAERDACAPLRASWLKALSTLCEDAAPLPASCLLGPRPLVRNPRAQPGYLGSLRWPQELASDRPKVEVFPLFKPAGLHLLEDMDQARPPPLPQSPRPTVISP